MPEASQRIQSIRGGHGVVAKTETSREKTGTRKRKQFKFFKKSKNISSAVISRESARFLTKTQSFGKTSVKHIQTKQVIAFIIDSAVKPDYETVQVLVITSRIRFLFRAIQNGIGCSIKAFRSLKSTHDI